MAKRSTRPSGAPRPNNPVIVVPGITASSLRDEYETEPERVWAMLESSYERVALHPDDTRYERTGPSRVRPDRVFEIPYGELIADLRHDLSPHADRPTPVYPFAYDWRQPLDGVEDELGGMVEEVVERASLLPHYYNSPWINAPRVNLVGHSMGGLIIAGYLEKFGSGAWVDKVVSVGSPFRGSLEAVVKITTGLSTIGGRSASREREMARLTPALYHLLPSFTGAVSSGPGMARSMFTPAAWQDGVVESIAESIRLHGRDASLSAPDKGARRLAAAATLFEGLLKDARRHRSRLERLDLAAAGLGSSKDWLCVVGVGEETRVRLALSIKDGGVHFDLRSVDRTNAWKPDASEWTARTGDGTVPFAGARCSFIPPEQVVCVCDDDFGYWELRDRILEGPAGVGLHGMLPAMNAVQKLIVAHFTGDNHDGVWGRRSPELAPDKRRARWDPPIAGLRERGLG
jgi:pimeloyl-ACP methyl ester carboxylesterase